MDARTPTAEPRLPFDDPPCASKGIPRGVEAELWRLATGICSSECSLDEFGTLAGVVVRWCTARSMSLADAATWLQRYGESRDLPRRFGAEKMQIALEVAFEDAREEGDASEEERPPECSDDALATTFAIRHRDDLRYVAAWGRWFIYDGTRWCEDDTLHAFDLARQVSVERLLSGRTRLASGPRWRAQRPSRRSNGLLSQTDGWRPKWSNGILTRCS